MSRKPEEPSPGELINTYVSNAIAVELTVLHHLQSVWREVVHLLWCLVRRDVGPWGQLTLCTLVSATILFFSWGWELFPGSGENGAASGIAVADGFLHVETSPLAEPAASFAAFDRVLAVDRDPHVPPHFLSDAQVTEMVLNDLRWLSLEPSITPDAHAFSGRGPRRGTGTGGGDAAPFPPFTPLALRSDHDEASAFDLAMVDDGHLLSHASAAAAAKKRKNSAEGREERSSHGHGGGGGRRDSKRRAAATASPSSAAAGGAYERPRQSIRPPPKVFTPLSLYHTRLHTYILYTNYRELRAEQLRRFQYFWGEQVMKNAEQLSSSRVGTGDGGGGAEGAREAAAEQRQFDMAHQEFRRVHLEAEQRQTRFVGLVQRTYLRALRHADAMRLESLHFLRLFALTVPALSEAWRGDDYCRWVGVRCHVIHIPLCKLLDERHGYLQAYSRDVFHRLPAAKRDDVTRRYEALLELGDKVNVNGRVRDEASGFAQRTRDLLLAQTLSNLNGGRTRYMNENGDHLKAETTGSNSSSSQTEMHTKKKKALEDLTEEQRAAAHLSAIALWYMLDDNATGTGLPSDTWTRAVWFEYHDGGDGANGQGFAKGSANRGRSWLRRVLRQRPPFLFRGDGGRRRAWGKGIKKAWLAPPRGLASARAPAYGQQLFHDEHKFPYEHSSLLLSALGQAPRVYYGSVEGELNPKHVGRVGRSTSGRVSTDADFVSPFLSPSTAPSNVSKYGGNVFARSSSSSFPTSAVMDGALREIHEALADTGLTQSTGKGRLADVDTIPVTVFSLELRDLGLAGFLPRRSDVRGEKEDCDGWGDGDDCHGHMHDPAALTATDAGLRSRSTREGPRVTTWAMADMRGPSPFFPAEFVAAPPVEYHAENNDLLPFVREDARHSTYRPPWAVAMDWDGREEEKKEGETAGPRRDAHPHPHEAEEVEEEDRVMRFFLEGAAARHGVTLTWEHVLQGEHARRRWLAEERMLKALRKTKNKKLYIIGPRAPSYWPTEPPIRSVLALRATVPGRGYPTATATDVGDGLRRVLTRLEFFGAQTQHHDLAEYFGFPASLGHFRGESESPVAPFLPLAHRGVHAKLAEWGLDLANTIEDGFVYASRLAKPLRHVDDDVTMGSLRPDLVPLVELDVGRNPSIAGSVPPHYFRFPLLRRLELTGSGVLFRIASKNYRSYLNLLSNDAPDAVTMKIRSATPFNGGFGNYFLQPIMPYISRSFVEDFREVTGSHTPWQNGGKPPRFYLASNRLLQEYSKLPPGEHVEEASSPIILATNNGDIRVTNKRIAELGEETVRQAVGSAAARVCTWPGMRYLFGLGAPLY